MFRISFVIIFTLVLFCSVACAEMDRETFEFEGRYWVTDLDAKAKIIESGIGGKFDFKSDLGVDDENLPEGRFYWHTGPNSKIRLAYTLAGFDGDKVATQAIEFNGQTFNIGTRVVSEFDLNYLRLGWIWQFLNFLDDKIKLGTVVEVKGINADVSLQAPALSIKESEELWEALPTVGVALDINPINRLNIFAEVSGLGAGGYGYFFDAEAGIKFMPIKYFTIFGGYRLINIKAEHDDDFVDIELSGPFMGATLKF
jgi:hypothetical protein